MVQNALNHPSACVPETTGAQCCPACGHYAGCTEENIVLDKQAAIILLTTARDALMDLDQHHDRDIEM